MTEELIKFTPGQRPEHIGPDALVYARQAGYTKWGPAQAARKWAWVDGWEFKPASPPLPDDQLEAQCKARGWTVTKPLVTQAERDRLVGALEAMDVAVGWLVFDIRIGRIDQHVRAFIDTYEAVKIVSD